MRDRLIEILDRYGDDISFCERCERPAEDCEGCKNEQLAEFLLANGVIVPPCKVGDVVYYFSHRPFNLALQANTIYEANVVRIVTTRLGTTLVIQIRNEYGCMEIPDIRSWGISVFPTKEEAERALKGVRGDG